MTGEKRRSETENRAVFSVLPLSFSSSTMGNSNSRDSSLSDRTQEVTAKWQKPKKKEDTKELTVIDNEIWTDEAEHYTFLSSFLDDLEALCQGIESGTFREPIHVRVRGRTAIRAVLDAVQKERLKNVRLMELRKDLVGGDYHEEAQMLSRCIENGNLENLEYLRFNCNKSTDDNGAVLSAIATGKAPNLASIYLVGECDELTLEKMARAMVDRKLTTLKYLGNTYGNTLFPLKNYHEILRIPQEFANKENEDILTFLQERWEYGEVQLATAKVIITGPSAVGKTCLVNCLKGNAFSPNPGSTNTMDIGKKVEDGGLVLFYHDFGGQRVYTASQGWFLETAGIFVVAWDRQDETGGDAARDQYARDVLDANPNAKLIFVTTKGDLMEQKPLSVLEQAELKEKYGDSFIGYYDVSAKANVGVAELLAAIKSAAGFANLLMPKTFEDLRNALMDMKENSDKWYMTRREWEELCESVSIVDRERELDSESENSRGHADGDRVKLALRLFLDMGEVVRLSTGHLIVKPTVLVDILSRVITADNRYAENARGGYLRHDEHEQVWGDYPKELHNGFLNLIHSCGLGFPVRDEKQDYKATLIPAMMSDSSGGELQQGLNHLFTDFPGFKAATQLVLEFSNLSNHLWWKILVKLHALVLFGGWWPNGYIVTDVDNTADARIVRSFGVVLRDDKKHQIVITAYGRSPSRVQLLRRRALHAIEVTARDFPGVSLQRLCMIPSTDVSCSEEWSEEMLFRLPVDTTRFEKHGAPDVAEWVLQFKEAAQADTWERPSFEYFMEMLQEGSGASDELLCYLLLAHQDEMLKKGCRHGRLDIKALWLIYNHKGNRVAYPLCPHLHPRKIRIEKDLGVSGVSDVDLIRLTEDQVAVKSLFQRIEERLRILPPRYKADFLGVLWHIRDDEYVFNVEHATARFFQPVQVDDFEVFVHESDQTYFTNPIQQSVIQELTDKARKLVFDTKTNASIPPRLLNEAWLFQNDSFAWLCERFNDGKRRKDLIKSVLDDTPITANIANAVKNKIRDRVKEEFPDFHSFYPKVIISYSTGYRKGFDLVDSAGPGLMVAAAAINFLFERGHPCYSDILTPGGRDWREYMLRLSEAKVMVAFITDTFCRSVHCLEEVAEAVEHRLQILPVRLDEKSVNGKDITNDKDAMWPDEELEKYAKEDRGLLAKLKLQRFTARRELSRIASIPDYGTILSEPVATEELVKLIDERLSSAG